MKIALGCDHAGYPLMIKIKEHLDSRGIEYRDFGTYSTERCDYPVFAKAAAKAVASGEYDLGILVCGTGMGISMAANKIKGIRAAVCSDCFTAEMSRRHNNANMLALGARVLGSGLALKLVDTFLDAPFEGGAHAKRVDMFMAFENEG